MLGSVVKKCTLQISLSNEDLVIGKLPILPVATERGKMVYNFKVSEILYKQDSDQEHQTNSDLRAKAQFCTAQCSGRCCILMESKDPI